MNNSIKESCPIVPNPCNGTMGQTVESGTRCGTGDGTESLKALADKVLNRSKVGQGVGRNVGQGEKSCPRHINPVGQNKAPVPPSVEEEQDPFDYQIMLAIEELNRRGVSIMNYPAATRHRALVLEEAFTMAANKGDRGEFIKLLRQWRNCFN